MNLFRGNNALSSVENNLSIIKGTNAHLTKIAQAELPYVQVHADSIIKRIDQLFELLRQDEADIQKIFEAAESGKITQDIVDEFTNGYSLIKHKHVEIAGGIYGLINMCKLAIETDDTINAVLKNNGLPDYERKELIIFNESEKKILNAATDLLDNIQKVFAYVDEILLLDSNTFKNNPKEGALKLRKKAASMYVKVLKCKEDTKQISEVLTNAVSVLESIRRKNAILEMSLSHVITELKHAPVITGGVEARKVSMITDRLKAEVARNGGGN